MPKLSETLSTEVKGGCTSPLILTGQTVITLDVKLKSGSHNNSRVTLQHSPDGVNWFEDPHSTNGNGSLTTTLATLQVRACVVRGEGSIASANIFITAK